MSATFSRALPRRLHADLVPAAFRQAPSALRNRTPPPRPPRTPTPRPSPTSTRSGRTFLTVIDNAAAGKYQTHFELRHSGLPTLSHRCAGAQRRDRTTTTCWARASPRPAWRLASAGLLNDVLGKPIRTWDSRGHNRPRHVRRAAPAHGPLRARDGPANSDPAYPGRRNLLPRPPSTARVSRTTRRSTCARASGSPATPRAPSPSHGAESRYQPAGGLRLQRQSAAQHAAVRRRSQSPHRLVRCRAAHVRLLHELAQPTTR